jgi:hypothetical protein
MPTTHDAIAIYVKRVRELSDYVEGSKKGTMQLFLWPFFTMLGYDEADLGDGLATPIDWAFKRDGSYAFFVEAEAIGSELAAYDARLADHFATDSSVKLAILTNGAQWRFFTDAIEANVMDRSPFARWDVLAQESPPLDLLRLLHKSKFDPELVRAYALEHLAA